MRAPGATAAAGPAILLPRCRRNRTPALAQDLRTAVLRRRALQWLAASGGSAAGFAGCGGGSDDASTADGASTGSSASTSCTAIPEESAGPYPGDDTTRRCCR